MPIVLNGTTGITTPNVSTDTSTLGPLTQALNLGSTGQIVFPATQNPSANANTLDDYEEGLWTPVLISSGATFSYPRGQYGSYCKVGGLVYAQFYIGADASGTTSNSCQIGGLPFSVANLGSLAQNSAAAWVSRPTALGFTASPGTPTIFIWQQFNAVNVATAAQVAGGYVVGHCVYRAET